jgi:acetyl-CoA synthetase
LAKESLDYIQKFPLASLKVIGSVENLLMRRLGIGTMTTLIKDVRRHLWQTETGGIMISPIPFVTPTKPTYATSLPAVYNLF